MIAMLNKCHQQDIHGQYFWMLFGKLSEKYMFFISPLYRETFYDTVWVIQNAVSTDAKIPDVVDDWALVNVP
jgi:hypothetical protein